MPQTVAVEDVLERIDQNEKQAIGRMIDWLKIPSVGTDPAYDAETARAAAWCADHLRESGFSVELIQTARPAENHRGQPVVFATCDGAPGYDGPHVLFYGHY
ncbi:MAG: hypothetical protein AAF235_10775, partial [Planctomycetota bacterium]